MSLSFQKLFFVQAFIFGVIAIMILASSVLIPLSLALLISFILFPVVKKLEGWGFNKLLAAFLSILMLFIVIGGGVIFFSSELMNLSDKLSDFTGKIMKTLSEVVVFVNSNVRFIDDFNRDELVEKGVKWFHDSSGSLMKKTFSNSASFVTGTIITIVTTFLFLIYREGLTKAFVAFGNEKNKDKIFRMLKSIQCVGKKYLSGMFLLIMILGFANSIGLLIIGVDSPFLFGFLAAIFSIVPFVGTLIGAAIAVLYTLISTDSLWTPVAVALLFWGIQTIESNFLNPKIVGSSLNVNPLVAIVSLIAGAAVWGVAGMVLFLPFAAILKVVSEEFHQLKPIAMLISSNISDNKKTKSYKWVKKIKGWFN